MENQNLKQYLKNQICLCGSANFKCTEFENITIILECNDCNRFEFINNNKYSGINWFSNTKGEIVFCEWGKSYPLFNYDNGNITQKRGVSFFKRNIFAKKTVYQIDKKIAIKQYKESIKANQEKLIKLQMGLKNITS